MKGGVREEVSCEYKGSFTYLDTNGASLEGITKEVTLPEETEAPVKKGETAGKAVYYLDGKVIGEMPVLFSEDVKEAGFFDCLKKAAEELF